MTERKLPDLTMQPIDPEIVEKVAGGEMCSASEINEILTNLQTNYETLIEFTSYVIERVATSTN